jgi:beta-xylosidase
MRPVSFPISLRPTSVPAQALEAITGRARTSVNGRSMLEPGERLQSPCNPLLPGLGFCDPHARIAPDGRILIYATHDFGPESKDYEMHDWWIWSTRDLEEWTFEGALRPEDTAIGEPMRSCWATDALLADGRCWWYLSDGPDRIRVMHGAGPTGPWRDDGSEPLVDKGLVSSGARDPHVFADDGGSEWLLFGTWDFYLARLAADRVSLAAPPQRLEIRNPQGPYGSGRTDDKPSLHRHGGYYHLTWGCFAARSRALAGPYDCDGCFFDPALAERPFVEAKQFFHDRHGSFFVHDGRWYFISNDVSQPGATPYFRDSVIVPIEYRADGRIAPARLARSWR